MCLKLISTPVGSRQGVVSGPRKAKKNIKKVAVAGKYTTLVSADNVHHTILVFSAPQAKARVCVAPQKQVLLCLTSGEKLHTQYLQQAFTGQMCRYEWGITAEGQSPWYQTTLVPLYGAAGEVEDVLSVTKEISDWGQPQANKLCEQAPSHTLAQLLLAARETEKREVAKALHDEVGSTSVILSALVSVAKQSIEQHNPKQALADLEKLHRQIQQSMERLHSIVVALRPPSLEFDGALKQSIKQLAEQMCQIGHLRHTVTCARGWREKGISERVKILLYRLVQESLNNVVKHAQASRVQIHLVRQQDQISVTVQDNGVGFVRSKQHPVNRVGLLSMHDSVRFLGGKLTITTAPGKGTRVHAVCPCVVYEETL